ncbi:MAG: hypothetical protein EZS28_001598 [Streblomastix strix]|uniref:Uncharacterized protein n=1 Tax=Streblomastix strix TaxID=222440 RepID=A0A5J4X772_9EUKA|nr:MAG: hypothetical protein EZS28_001598 [Streblomastix strix]
MEEAIATQEFESKGSQCSGRQSGAGGSLIEVDKMEDDYDQYKSHPAGKDRMKSRAKPFERLSFHPSMIQSARKREVHNLEKRRRMSLLHLLLIQAEILKRLTGYHLPLVHKNIFQINIWANDLVFQNITQIIMKPLLIM